MKKINLFTLAGIFFVFPLLAQANNDLSVGLPAPSIIDVIQNTMDWAAIIFTVLSSLSILIFGVVYLFKNIETEKKIKKILIYSLGIFVISVLFLMIDYIFFKNYI